MHLGHDLPHPRPAAALEAALDDATMLPRRPDKLPALPHVVGHRLFHVNVLARLAGPHRRQRVPVVRAGDGHGVHLPAVQQLSHVPASQHLLAPVAQSLGPRRQHILVHVT
jgi:hypothetical protein